MYISIFVTELPVIPDLRGGGQKVYSRVEFPMEGETMLCTPVKEFTEGTLQDMWRMSKDRLMSIRTPVPVDVPPDDAS